MSQIKIENLSFAYPGSGDSVFENLNLQLDSDWKLGFIGRNGRGKTTLLRLLLGEGEYPYEGKIIAGLPFDYFPYPVAHGDWLTMEVLQEHCGQAGDWQLLRELRLLGFPEEAQWRPFDSLSQGEQTKALLAALFLREDRFHLIDEPTNHLDGEARRQVSRWLAGKRGYILVSHDRAFLDGCVDHILALNKSRAEIQCGSFSSWWENKARRDAFEQEQNLRLKKEIQRLEQASQQRRQKADAVERAKTGIASQGIVKHGLRPYLGEKSRKGQQQRKNIDRRAERALEEKENLLKDLEQKESLKLAPLTARERLLELREICLFYGEKQVCGPVCFQLEPGERIALHGSNGSGKSTLMTLLLGETEANYTGTVTRLSGLRISYVPQDTAFLRGSLRDYARERDLDESLFKAILRKMDFSREQFEKDMADFSAGQKKKVLLAGSLCQQAHLYLWDEPLNFIDIYSRMQIEELLLQYRPTMVFVEHDEAFRQRIATKVIEL